MTLNANISPYYDDYDETKNYHQIMFKPGMAVQSRELTQMQTILQNQTKRFGDSVFKDGALVSGGAQFVESVTYVKLASSTLPNVADLVGLYATSTNGSVYRIKDAIGPVNSDPLTIYCIPVTNLTGNVLRVDPSDVLTIKTLYTDAVGIGTVTAASTSPTGVSVFFNVDTGIYYTNGFFVRSEKSSICLSKYEAAPTKIVGFDIVETFVDSTNAALGGETLLDPAQGSYNYAAPGADRYRVDLALRVISTTDISSPVTTTSAFIELNRIIDGQVSKRAYANQYSLIGDTMARRTYDESGDYVVQDFGFRLEPNSLDPYFDVLTQPGKAYIKGYEIETLVPQRLRVDKARTTSTVTGYDIPVYYGNYLLVSGLAGGTTGSMFNVSALETISLYSATTPTSTNKIGSGRVKSIEWVSGTGLTAIYKLFLTDVISTGNLFLVKSVTNLAYNTFTIKATVDGTGITNITGNTSFVSGTSSIVVSAPTTILVGMAVSGTGIAAGSVVTSVTASTIGLSAPTTGSSSGTVAFSATNFYDNNYDNTIFRIPHPNVASITSLEYAVRRKIDLPIVTGSGSVTLGVSGERFKDVSSNTNISRHYIGIVASKTTGTLAVGELLMFTVGGPMTLTLNVSSNTLTVNVGDPTFNGTVQLVATIDIQAAPLKTKTINAVSKTKTLGSGLFVPGTVYSLGYGDVNNIVGVYESVDTNPASTSSTNITSRFELKKNPRDSFYDHSTIELISGQTAPVNPILVVFDVLEHSSGHGYFGPNSYPVYNDIPTYTDNIGKKYELRDCIDFRSKRTDNTSPVLSVYTSSGITLTGQQNIDTIYNFANAEYNYYLSRIDKIIMKTDGSLGVLSGIPSLDSPQEPADSDTGMTIAILKIPPYTKSKDDVVTTLIKNRRFTMKDIGKIEDRVSRLEYYSTLNELEKEITNTTFTSPSNEILFNSGFIVDTFRGHGIGNVTHPDYKCSIDFRNKTLRPKFNANAAQWVMTVGNVNGLNYVSKNKFALLPLNTVPEVNVLTQTVASKTLSVNPFNVQSFVGTLRLSPDRDIWYNTTTLPDVVTNEANDAAAVLAGIQSTEWGEWILTTQVQRGVNEIKSFTRSGEQTEIEAKTVVRSSKTDAVTTTFSYVMRDQDIEYVVDSLRPNTFYSVFFDGINITGSSVLQYSSTSLAYDDPILKTDSNGSARGLIKIRNNLFTSFKSGKKLVQISDGYWNPMVSTTYAEATFYSEGRDVVEQTSKVMGVDYVTVKRSVTDTKIEVRDTYTPSTYDPPSNTGGTDSTGTRTFYGTSFVQDGNAFDILTNGAATAYTRGGYMTDAEAIAILDNYPPATESGPAHIYPSNGDSISNTFNMGIRIGLAEPDAAPTYNATGVAAVSAFVSSGSIAAELGREPSANEVALFMAYAATSTDSPAAIIAAGREAIQNLASTGETFYGYSSAGTPIMCQGDPTAQTFFITNDSPDGIFISSIDTYFSAKDGTGTIPITLELRPTVNGYPNSYKVIPGSVIVKQSADVVVPTTNVNAPLPTTWTFETPIHLYPGEYSIVLKSDSSDYRVYVAEIGGKKLGTDEVISSQQTLGSYFASQNATTWTPDQNIDLMFAIRRASFKTDLEYASVFDLDRAVDALGVGVDVLFDMLNLNASYSRIEGKTSVKFEISTKSVDDIVSPYTQIIPGNDIFPGYRSKHFVSGDTKLKITMSTTDERLSPYAEVFPSGFIMVQNIINNGDVAFPDTLPTGSGSDAVYITKPYVLEEGFDATSARVLLLENVPTGSSIEVYMKGLSGNDSSDIQDLSWIPLTRKTPVRNPSNFYEYYDTEYVLDNFAYSTYTTYRAVMFKIVLKTTDPARAPSGKRFRAISLA